MAPTPITTSGSVYLVGAGPGDPGLITLRGVECLRRADLVLYDYLVNPGVLIHLCAGAEAVCLGRHGEGRMMTQDEVNQRMIAAARGGSAVVRLKGGDPAIFARLAEETRALEAAGVPYEIVPGITAALAAGSYAGAPLTHRGSASAVAFVTGHEDEEKEARPLDYRGLASFPGTLVFYMGVTSAATWTGELLAGGKAPETPVAILRRCSWPDQVCLRTTLAELPDAVARQRIRPPAVIIVGEAAAQASGRSWFTQRPLFGQRVLVTRPADQAAELRRPLEELGAEVLIQPAIEVHEPADWAPVDAALARLDQYDWLVFSSANGVERLLSRLCRDGRDLRQLGGVRLAAIGPGTADELAGWRLTADLVPAEYHAEALVSALTPEAAGRRFLLARASRGREVLAEGLRAAGGQVDQVVVYRSLDVKRPDPAVAALLAAGRLDWITVTSSAIARSLVSLFGDELRRARLVSISSLTSHTLRELGHSPAAEAEQATIAGVVEAILRGQGGT